MIVVNTFTPTASLAGKTAMPVPGDLRRDPARWLAHLTNLCCAGHDRRGRDVDGASFRAGLPPG